MKKPLLSFLASLAFLGSTYNTNAQFGASLDFDGIDDQVNNGAGLNATLDNLNTITVEARVSPSTTTGFGCIVGNYNTIINNAQMQFLLRRDGDTYTFWVDDGTGFYSTSSPAASVVPGTWQHVAGTWDGTELKIYINGTVQGATNGITGVNLRTTANNIVIGGNSMGEMFSGRIDEVRIWGVTRSAGLISSYMNCNVTDTAAGLLAMYNFNEGPPNSFNVPRTTLHDVTGNGHDGTLTGFTLLGNASNYVGDSRFDYLSLQSSVGSLANADRLYNGAAIDFDFDQDMDMLVTADNGETRLYLNDGRGHFSNTFLNGITPGAGFSSYSTGDLDGDADADFVVTNQTNVVTAYINDGSGSFTPLATNLLNGTGAGGVSKIVDLNGDGMMDIVVGNNTANATDSTEVWINTGTFGNAAFTYTDGLDNFSSKGSIATGDVDGDGDIDIITGSYSYGAELFLNNNNNGTFTQGTISGAYSNYVFLYDWDMDGDLDYLTYDRYNNAGLRVFSNNGSGNFGTTSITLLQSPTINMCVLNDINGDGFADVVANHFGGNAYVYISNGCQLTLQTGCHYTLDYADNFVEVADYNNDGTPDIFCGARNHLATAHMNFLNLVTTPALSHITSAPDVSACLNNAAVLTATASNSGTVNWFSVSTGGSSLASGASYTTAVLSSTTTVSYYAEASNANGCISTWRDTVKVTVNPTPVITISDDAICAGASYTLAPGGAVSYTFNPAGPVVTPTSTATYTITGTDANNCMGSDDVTITVNNLPNVGATATSMTLCLTDDDTLNASGAATYTWSSNAASATTSSVVITPATTDTYTVTGTDVNSCVNTTTLSVTVINCSTGITQQSKNNWVVYPNPTSGNFTLQSLTEIGAVEVYNSLGALIYKTNSKDTKIEIDLSREAAGIYYLHTQDKKVMISKQ